jgi:hypothetical protein
MAYSFGYGDKNPNFVTKESKFIPGPGTHDPEGLKKHCKI